MATGGKDKKGKRKRQTARRKHYYIEHTIKTDLTASLFIPTTLIDVIPTDQQKKASVWNYTWNRKGDKIEAVVLMNNRQ